MRVWGCRLSAIKHRAGISEVCKMLKWVSMRWRAKEVTDGIAWKAIVEEVHFYDKGEDFSGIVIRKLYHCFKARMKRSHFVMGTLKIVRQTVIIKITWAVAMQLINSQYFELMGNELTCPADRVCSRARSQNKPHLHLKPTISIPSCIFSVNHARTWMSVGCWSWSVMQSLDQPKGGGESHSWVSFGWGFVI